MLSNANIYAKEWLDIVFAGRNKSYGAYELRRRAPRAMNIALCTVLAVVSICCALAQAKGQKEEVIIAQKEEVIEAMIDDREILDIEEIVERPKEATGEQPQQVAQDVPAQDVIRFTEINATDATRVEEDMVATTDVLDKRGLPGNITAAGVRGGAVVPNGTFGRSRREGGATGVGTGSVTGSETGKDVPFESVEIMPAPIGGMKEFVKWVAENYSFPQGAIDNDAKGLIQVSFVVETDGSLSTFEVVKDMGYGTGTAAVGLLKKAKKWNPGIQNGRPVRVAFTLPIRLQLNQQ